MVLIFTNKEDTHPTNVIKYLTEWSVEVFRFNTECLLTDYRFGWWCNDEGCDFYIRNIRNGREMYGHQVTAVWDRRPLVPSSLPVQHENEEINKHILDEAHSFLSFLRYWMRNIYSIGSIVEDRPADSKMLQLSVARSLGMRIPDTCFSNMRDKIIAMTAPYEFLSLKPIGSSSVLVGDTDEEYVFYSQKVRTADLQQMPESTFSQSVNFVQNYVEKAFELRITVCCNDIVACKIDSQAMDDDKGKIDWRQGYDYDLKHEIVELPEKIKTFCHQFLEKMKLNFGCFDFIVTPEGDYVFLECNPNGQWLWIEILTGYDISMIVARNLAKYEKPYSNKDYN
jgi:hypothetical protein